MLAIASGQAMIYRQINRYREQGGAPPRSLLQFFRMTGENRIQRNKKAARRLLSFYNVYRLVRHRTAGTQASLGTDELRVEQRAFAFCGF